MSDKDYPGFATPNRELRAAVADRDATIARLTEELTDRREAMHQIYWLNLAPRIEEICTEVYQKWGGLRADTREGPE